MMHILFAGLLFKIVNRIPVHTRLWCNTTYNTPFFTSYGSSSIHSTIGLYFPTGLPAVAFPANFDLHPSYTEFPMRTPPAFVAEELDDRMDDGEIPWDFVNQTYTNPLHKIMKKNTYWWNNPFSYFEQPEHVSFIFI